MPNPRTTWTLFRGLLAVSGLSLMLYVGYRYLVGGPPDVGAIYAVALPASTLLGGTVLVLAVKPFALAESRGAASLRLGLVALGSVWMASGMVCGSLLDGTLHLLHGLGHHAVVPLGLFLLAGVPGWVERRVEGAG